jgi:CBS domain-containing protein
MKVQEAMSSEVHLAHPNQPISTAAKMMAERKRRLTRRR